MRGGGGGGGVAYSLICVFVLFVLGCIFVLFLLFVRAKSFRKKIKRFEIAL